MSIRPGTESASHMFMRSLSELLYSGWRHEQSISPPEDEAVARQLAMITTRWNEAERRAARLKAAQAAEAEANTKRIVEESGLDYKNMKSVLSNSHVVFA